MFSGIINHLGAVVKRTGSVLEVKAKLKPKLGASIAINGVCLTVTKSKGGVLSFDVGPDTWARTNLRAARRVNVEPSLRVGDEISGHFVAGHVDACAEVLAFAPWEKGFRRLRVATPPALRGLLPVKGSVAVDGVSLTVTASTPRFFEIMLVPHTLEHTTLGRLKPGDRVNLEADPMARYAREALKGMTRDRA
ncbi:MAG: riboflavin synthase [Elusimicrobiota bacterium]|nr:riboflavin synthase [Elusimicrobiota bacterium]